MIEQALRDLKYPTDSYGRAGGKSLVHDEALDFFTAGGDWAVSRNVWFQAVGLDELAVFEALKPWLQGRKLHQYRTPAPVTPIEPALATLAVIPRDGVFSLQDICKLRPDLKAVSLQKHLDRLVETGHLRQLPRGQYLKLRLQQTAAE